MIFGTLRVLGFLGDCLENRAFSTDSAVCIICMRCILPWTYNLLVYL